MARFVEFELVRLVVTAPGFQPDGRAHINADKVLQVSAGPYPGVTRLDTDFDQPPTHVRGDLAEVLKKLG